MFLLTALLVTEAGVTIAQSVVAAGHGDRREKEVHRGLVRVTDHLRRRETAARETAARVADRIVGNRQLADADPLARADLFRALEEMSLPTGVAGVLVRGADGQPAAWRGRTFPTAVSDLEVLRGEIEVDGGGTVTAFAPLDPARPLSGRTPLGERLAERFDLARVSIEGPDSGVEGPTEHRASTPWRSTDGRTLARVTVAAHPLSVPLARVDATGRALRAVILGLLLLVIVRLAGSAVLRPGAGLLRLVDFTLITILARVAMHHIGFPSEVLTGDALDPAAFSYPVDPFGLELGFFYSPGDLVLTALGVLAVTWVLLTWAARRLTPPVRRLRPGLLLAGPAVLASVLAIAFWFRFLHLLPFYSTVDYFPEQSVLPQTGAVVVLLGAFLLTISLLAITSSTLLLPTRLIAGDSTRGRWLVLAGFVAPLTGALLLLTGQPPIVAPLTAITVAASAALFAVWPALGFGIRLGVFTGLATVLTFAPFTNEVWEETLADVSDHATELFRAAPETPLEQRLTSDLEEIARDERLARALAEDPERERPDLAFALWADGPLSRHPRGSDLMILSRSGNHILSRFEIDMPPRGWLPVPLPGFSTDKPQVQPRPGRERGARQVFLVGTAPVRGDEDEYLGLVVVRMPRERPLVGEARRPDLLRSLDRSRTVPHGRELYYSEYAGDRLEYTTNPAYPRVHRAPAAAVERILERNGSRHWVQEKVAGATWMNLYRPRYEDGERTGLRCVGFRTTAPRSLFLAFFKLLLVNALAAAVAAVAGFATGLRRLSPRFQHKLLLSYLIVSAVPVLLLAEVNRTVARETVEEQMEESLRRAMRRVTAELRDRGTFQSLADVMRTNPAREDLFAVVSNEMLKEIGYRLGHEINLFVTHAKGEWGGPLVASSEPGIFATGIFSERLPGRAWRETVLLEHEFVSATEQIGEYAFLVGYSPIVANSGHAVGVLSIPMIYGQDAVDRELARRNSLILALYLLILFIVIFIGMVLARRISSPIERLAEATRRLSAGDLDYRIPHQSRDEFGHLVDSFNRMTEDLRRSRETIVRAEKDAAWREMAKQIAHEIKNPLTPMRLSAQQILRAHEDGHEDFVEIFRRGLDTIIRQTESLRRIASEFSAFARLPARRMTGVDAATLAREVAGLYSGTENVEVVERIGVVPPVVADREELKRVLVNLASNAMQAMEKDGGTLTIAVAAVAGGTEISVADTGVGIPDADLAKLFEPNFSTKTGGTGLGLAISKAVVTTCGGTIEVSSEVGRGTVVRVVLPPDPNRTEDPPAT